MDPRFGLNRRPFRLTPDPAAYLPLPAHEMTGAALGRAFHEGEAVALLDGEPGTGKTLLGVRFLESLDFEIPRVMVNAPRQMKPAELFQGILFDLGLAYQGLSEHELRLAVTGELLAVAESKRRFVLFVDEAHHLSAEAVEELRALCNVESQGGPVAFVVLAGWPPLRTLVSGNRSFSQRVALRSRLEPLTPDDAQNFLREQVRACGGRSEWLFHEEALSLVVELAGGVPRELNRLAGLAMMLAENDGADVVDAEAVLAAAEELELTVPPKSELMPEADEFDTLPHPNQVPRPPQSSRFARRKTA